MSTKSIYEDGTYFANNPTWDEEDSSWKAEKIERLLKKTAFIHQQFARLDVEPEVY